MSEDYRHHSLVAQMLAGKRHGRPGGSRCGQWVNQYPAAVTVDQGEIGQVETAQLVDALGNLEQTMDTIELGLPPEAGVYRLRCGPFDK